MKARKEVTVLKEKQDENQNNDGDNAKIEKTEVTLRWSDDPPLLALWLARTFETLNKINTPTIKM